MRREGGRPKTSRSSRLITLHSSKHCQIWTNSLCLVWLALLYRAVISLFKVVRICFLWGDVQDSISAPPRGFGMALSQLLTATPAMRRKKRWPHLALPRPARRIPRMSPAGEAGSIQCMREGNRGRGRMCCPCNINALPFLVVSRVIFRAAFNGLFLRQEARSCPSVKAVLCTCMAKTVVLNELVTPLLQGQGSGAVQCGRAAFGIQEQPAVDYPKALSSFYRETAIINQPQ